MAWVAEAMVVVVAEAFMAEAVRMCRVCGILWC